MTGVRLLAPAINRPFFSLSGVRLANVAITFTFMGQYEWGSMATGKITLSCWQGFHSRNARMGDVPKRTSRSCSIYQINFVEATNVADASCIIVHIRRIIIPFFIGEIEMECLIPKLMALWQ